MPTPFDVLGVPPDSDAAQIRSAYYRLVKRWHPDTIADMVEREQAQQKLVEINLAYEKALKATHSPIPNPKKVARSLMERGQHQAALRILEKSVSKDAEWFYLHGCLLMRLRNPGAAHESFREAVKLEPDNYTFRQGALDAALAHRKKEKLRGRIGEWIRRMRLSQLTGKIRL